MTRRRDRYFFAARLVASVIIFIGATYCLVTLRDPIPSLSRALDDRHAYFATTLLVLAPILLGWHIAILVATLRREHAPIPHAVTRR